MKRLIYLPPLRRLLAVLVALVFAALPSWAVEDQTALHLIFKDGSSTWFLLAEKPVLTFTGTQMSVNSSTVSVSYDFADIAEYRFCDKTDALHPLQKDATRIVRQPDGDILIYGCPEGAVRLYDLSGHQLPASVHPQAGALRVSLRTLPAGTYLIRMNHQTIKVAKK